MHDAITSARPWAAHSDSPNSKLEDTPTGSFELSTKWDIIAEIMCE